MRFSPGSNLTARLVNARSFSLAGSRPPKKGPFRSISASWNTSTSRPPKAGRRVVPAKNTASHDGRKGAVPLNAGSGCYAVAGPWQAERRVTTATDEFYRDIIEGLAIHSGSAFE